MLHTARLLGQARRPQKNLTQKGNLGFVGDFPIHFRERLQVATTLGASELAGRYAAALFDLADERKQLDDVATDFRQLESMFAANADLRRLARSPVIGRDEKTKALTALLTRVGVAPLTMQFVGVLSRNRRLFALPQIIAAYLFELSRRRGETAAEITSAQELSDTQRSAVEKALVSVHGGKIAIQQKVDPGLIGGLVVKIGSRMVDSSLRTQLQRLRLAMKGAG